MNSSPRILVNGATGTLGQATIAALRGQNVVAGTRRLQSSIARSIHIPEDGHVTPTALTGVDVIINCAGRVTGTEVEIMAANVDHVRGLARAAEQAGVRRFVQVSSFSIFGEVEHIDTDTPLAPATAYGRSKVAAENVLQDIAEGGRLATLSVRLPFMFDRNKPALMGPLIALVRRTPLFPVAPYAVHRSMLTYPDAASRLAEFSMLDDKGTINVADPLPFTTELLITLMRKNGLRAPKTVTLSKSIIRLIGRSAPGISRRLFASSRLTGIANGARDRPFIGITAELDALLGQLGAKG